MTITLISGAKPIKLLEILSESIELSETKGVYKVSGWKVAFPIQIVVTKELAGNEYAIFRTISKNPSEEDLKQVLYEGQMATDDSLLCWYRDFFEIFSKLDGKMLEDAKRRYSDMAKTWREIFEFDKEIEKEKQETTALNIRNLMDTLKLTLEQAMDALKIPADQRSTYAKLVKGV